jgi:hypothetical protein
MQVDKKLRARLKREASKQLCRARLFKYQQRYANVHPTLKEHPQEKECLPKTNDSSEFLLLVGDTEAETFEFDYRIAEHYFPLSMHLYEAGAAVRGNLSFELLCRFISALHVDGSGFTKEVDHNDLDLFHLAAYFFKSCKCLDLLQLKYQQRYANVHLTLKEYPQEKECLPETYDGSEFLLLEGDTEAETFKFDYRIAEHYFPLSVHLYDAEGAVLRCYEAGTAVRGNLSFELLCRFISALHVDGRGFAKEVDHNDLHLFHRAAHFFRSRKCLDLLRDMIVEAIGMIQETIATKMKLVSDLTNCVLVSALEENNRLQIIHDTVFPE